MTSEPSSAGPSSDPTTELQRLFLLERLASQNASDDASLAELETRVWTAVAAQAQLPDVASGHDSVDRGDSGRRGARENGPAPFASRRISLRRPAMAWMSAAASVVAAVVFLSGQAPAVAATPPLLVFSTPTGGPSLGDTLSRLAAVAAAHPEALRGGSVQRVAMDHWALIPDEAAGRPGLGVVVPIRSEWSLYPDGHATEEEQRGRPLMPDGRVPDSPLTTSLGSATRSTLMPDGRAPGLLETLSRDPAQLEAQLSEAFACRADPSTTLDVCLVDAIYALHRTYVVPSDLEATFWLLLAEVAGVEDLGTGLDRAGRSTVAVGSRVFEVAGLGRQRLALLVDTQTGRLVGAEWLLVEPAEGVTLRAPAVVGFTIFRSSEWVGVEDAKSLGE
jgi:hypothetical protein